MTTVRGAASRNDEALYGLLHGATIRHSRRPSKCSMCLAHRRFKLQERFGAVYRGREIP